MQYAPMQPGRQEMKKMTWPDTAGGTLAGAPGVANRYRQFETLKK